MNSNLTTIGEISKIIISGGTPNTQNAAYWNGEFPWLSSGETRNRFIESTEKTITQQGIDESSTRLIHKNSIVIASAGQGNTRGQASFCLIDTYINQSIIGIEIDETIADPYYVFLNLSKRYQELRQISDSTSIRGSLTTKLVRNLTIVLPPLEVQRSVSSLIRSFDNLISVNQKINDYLS